MLILSRREGESIEIPELGVVIEVTSIKKSRVSIGIEAPKELAIRRSEMGASVSPTNQESEAVFSSKCFPASNVSANNVSASGVSASGVSTATLKEPACRFTVSDQNQPLVFQVA